MKDPVRVKIDLTKKHHNLLVSANKCVSNIDSVKFFYADANCGLKCKIKWEDESISYTFFYSLAELKKSHVNTDEWKLKSSLYLLWLAWATLAIMESEFFSNGCVFQIQFHVFLVASSQVFVSIWCFKLRVIRWVI